ncbi:hypothetical protein [Catalinimonas niigatensis]|uniref:hypothetical protein n=1 Tax=Catalinimonas niigatensis TaxID=1397264 RepID=UPI0026655F52|nr:hypothetical protein [Catalinimonas niigatensis]WPP48769.1 hypothetical protein PZB72_19060 [Catalinimonas niigatensis]
MAASTYHVALISKFGPSLMEFKLYEDSVSWIKTFDQLNKKSVKNLIEKDFRLLLLTELDHPEKVKAIKKNDTEKTFMLRGVMKSRVTLEAETQHVVSTENRQLFNPVKTKVHFQYDQQEIPAAISLEHTHVNMGLDLKLLKVKHAEK